MTVARCRVGVAAPVCVSERRLGRTRKCEGAGQSLGDASRRHPSCLEIEDTGNASSCTFSTLHHGVLEPASCMTRQAASKEAQRWNFKLRTRPRLGRRQGTERPTKAYGRRRRAQAHQILLCSNHTCHSREFSFIPLQSMHSLLSKDVTVRVPQSQWTDSDRIFQQNTGEHCDISPSMSRSFLLIQCT